MELTEKIVDEWALRLCERIIEIRFIDVDELKVAMSSHFKAALFDCLSIQISDIEKNRAVLTKRYAEEPWNTHKLQAQLIPLKVELTKHKRAKAMVKDMVEYLELKRWVKERFGQSFIDEFHSHVNDFLNHKKQKQ